MIMADVALRRDIKMVSEPRFGVFTLSSNNCMLYVSSMYFYLLSLTHANLTMIVFIVFPLRQDGIYCRRLPLVVLLECGHEGFDLLGVTLP